MNVTNMEIQRNPRITCTRNKKIRLSRAFTEVCCLFVVHDLFWGPGESNFLVSSAGNAWVTLDLHVPFVSHAQRDQECVQWC